MGFWWLSQGYKSTSTSWRDLEGSPDPSALPSAEMLFHSRRHACLFLKSSRESNSVCGFTLVLFLQHGPCGLDNILKGQDLHFFPSCFKGGLTGVRQASFCLNDFVNILTPQDSFLYPNLTLKSLMCTNRNIVTISIIVNKEAFDFMNHTS